MFHTSCDILDELGKAFLSAQTMARLAKDMVKEVERVAAGMGTTKSRAQCKGKSNEHCNSNRTWGMTILPRDTASNALSTQCTSTLQDNYPNLDVNDGGDNPHATTPHAAAGVPLDLDVFSEIVGSSEMFNEFDPSFDLDRMDAIFSANLDPNLPFLLDEWSENTQFI